MRRTILLALAIGLGLIALGGALRPQQSRAEEAIDISGDWALDNGCILYVVQNGEQLTGAACRRDRIEGRIDSTDGTFTLGWLDSWNSMALQGSVLNSTMLTGTLEDLRSQSSTTFYASRIPDLWGIASCDYSPGPHIPDLNPPPFSRALDALRVLQAAAHLAPVPCGLVDVNIDGLVDGQDASLILQREAGLISRLPVL